MTDRNKDFVPGKRMNAVQKDGIVNTRVSAEERNYWEGVHR